MTKYVFVLLLIIPNLVFADVVKELSIGEVDEEFTVIDESLQEKDRWIEPVFAKSEGRRKLASVFSRKIEVDEDSIELAGQLQVVSEIPYTQPSQYRWALKKRVLRSFKRRAAKKKKTAKNKE